MATAKKNKEPVSVSDYLRDLDHPLVATAALLRQIILDAGPEVGEQIKWNAPAFYFTGAMKAFDAKEYKRDIVVFNLRKPDYVLLIFPTGAAIPNPGGLLEGNYADGRRMVTIRGEAEAEARKILLQRAIKDWLAQVERP